MSFRYFDNSSLVGKPNSGGRKIDDIDSARHYGLALFPFTTFTFTDGGGSGHLGQSLASFLADSDYNTSTYSWLNNTDYFNVTTNDGTYPLGIQLFTIPKTGTYRIEARGAHGGNAGTTGTATNYTGGIGAQIRGDFSLTQGEKLEILVGHSGSNRSGSYGGACGGGGSFVVKENASVDGDILVIAGGGGGAEYYSTRNSSDHGGNGRLSTYTGGSGGNSSQTVGTYGQPAPNYSSGSYGDRARGGYNGYGGGGAVAGGGGGYFDRGGTGNATSSLMLSNTQCGYGYLTGTGYTSAYRGQGGRSNSSTEYGGFGGGGGSQISSGYGGGGGGYSGGGGGNFAYVSGGYKQGNGGGGGSYNSGANKAEFAYTQATHPGTITTSHDAYVTIEAL